MNTETTLDTAAGPVRALFGGRPLDLRRADRDDGAHGTHGVQTPVVVLVHGSGGDASVWAPLLPHCRAVTAVAIDLPGRGASRAARLPSAAAYAAFVDQVRAALGVQRVVVVGQSLGGAIAQHHALDFEAHCAGIVVANSALDFSISAERLQAIDDDWDATAARYAQGQVSSRAGPTLQAAALAMVRSRDRAAFQDDLRVCNGFDAKPWAHRIRVPVLVTAGHEDPLVVPARSIAVYERIAHASLLIFAPSGHCTQLEQPERFAAVIEGFAARCAEAH